MSIKNIGNNIVPFKAAGNGGNGGSMDLESRVAVLEAHVEHIRDDIREIKTEIKEVISEVKGLRSEMQSNFNGLRSEMHTNFRWMLGIFIGMWATGFGTVIALLLKSH
ncbi:hypothetical protein BH10PSE19_BH10PSE19_10150 [soil metagenome]